MGFLGAAYVEEAHAAPSALRDEGVVLAEVHGARRRDGHEPASANPRARVLGDAVALRCLVATRDERAGQFQRKVGSTYRILRPLRFFFAAFAVL